jgi:RND family efflux transporter MFP subunit
MNLSQTFLASAALGALALTGCSHTGGRGAQAAQPLRVHIAAVRDGTLQSQLDLAGSISAADAANVGAISAGRIVAMNVRVGDRVNAGALIAQVDATGYRAQLAQAQSAAQAASAQASAAAAQAQAARSQLHLAEVTAERMSVLYNEGAISRQDYDQTQANLQAARAGMQQAVAGSSAAQAAADAAIAGATAASVPVTNTSIRAPFSGVVTGRMLDVGAVVGPGTPVVALENDNALELDVALPNDAGAAVYPGEIVAVRVDALGSATLAGKIRAASPSENPALRSTMLRIAIAQPRAGRLQPGMYARVSIPVSATGLAVPRNALVTRAGQSGVFTVYGGHAHFVPVDAGTTYGGLVRVDGAGFRGARIAVSNLERLTDGATVTVVR